MSTHGTLMVVVKLGELLLIRQRREYGDGQPVLTNMATRLDTTRILVLRHCWVHPKISGLRDGFGGLVKCGHIARISTIRRPVR